MSFEKEDIYQLFLLIISVAQLPNDYATFFWGAKAVTSASGQGAIVQHIHYFYELTCEVSGCTWRILPNQLNPGVTGIVMMTLPSDYNAGLGTKALLTNLCLFDTKK